MTYCCCTCRALKDDASSAFDKRRDAVGLRSKASDALVSIYFRRL
uniref:DUF397 domain-containing protein n=1 Tax=Heterorhabditis bacteriophora TaxID=37862 RepID=A0A1I7WMP4_HETBA